jgi:sulfite reductase alpha subunit-like flavoprotein
MFDPGDHIEVLPANDPEQASAVMAALHCHPKLVVKIAAPQGDEKNVIPEKVSLLHFSDNSLTSIARRRGRC